MLAATIRVDRPIKRDIRRAVAGDDGFRGFDTDFGALGLWHFLIPAVVFHHTDSGRKTVMQVGGRAAPARRQRSGHERAPILFFYTV